MEKHIQNEPLRPRGGRMAEPRADTFRGVVLVNGYASSPKNDRWNRILLPKSRFQWSLVENLCVSLDQNTIDTRARRGSRVGPVRKEKHTIKLATVSRTACANLLERCVQYVRKNQCQMNPP